MLKTFIEEQKDFFAGARISKIQQPSRREVLLSLRNNGLTRQFYINIDPKFYHICFPSQENIEKRLIEIPQKPPMFCMLLRKYLNNSVIEKINQPDGERIFEIYIRAYNEIGDKIYLCLAIELMGKYSNVILYNTDTNIILGAAHNVGADKSSVREVYGTIPYTYPPFKNSVPFLVKRYSFITPEKLYRNRSVNDILDNYYTYLISKDKYSRLKREYSSIISKELKKTEKKLAEQKSLLDKNSCSDKYRLAGDLIMANIYSLKDYSDSASVYDYENNKQIYLKLNPLKTIKENANIFYNKYKKSKSAKAKILEITDDLTMKTQYLKSILYSVEIAQNVSELGEIAPELDFTQKIGTPHNSKNSPLLFEYPNETRIYVGKNNRQNDYIVSKLASDEDLWFHTKNCPGSHVLLKTQKVTDELILECAKLAKEYSSASKSSKIGVIYTKCKYLRKPPKAALGYVTYRNEKEIVVD